jgi:exopolysaccharide biosynthesis polyprenyl glycosylphosphotransferase
MPPLFSDANRRLLRVADACILLASFLIAAKAFPHIRRVFAPSGLLYTPSLQELSPNPSFGEIGALSGLLWVFVLVLAITIFAMDLLGGYESFTRQSRLRLLTNSVLAPASGIAVVTVTFYAVKFPGYSRIFLFTFIVLSAIGITTYRICVHALVTHRFKTGVYARETALVGQPDAVISLAKFFAERVPQYERRVIGYFNLGESETSPDLQHCNGLPNLGSVEHIGATLIHMPIQDVVIIVPPDSGAEWSSKVLKWCDYFRISAHIIPAQLLSHDLADLHILPTHFCTLPAVTLAPDEENGDSGVYFWKRLIDVVVSATALVIFAPLFAIIGIAIKLTTPSLSVFYRWNVVGFRGRRFTGYKFTTMVADADDRKEDLMALNEMTGPVFKVANDPRITSLGGFLRKYSLNELPQFWSVLVGDMSLVGPRPAGPHELARYEMWHKRKLSVRPGITCFWQVRGRNKISNFDDWVRMDLEYIQKRCTRLDIQILLRTAWVVIRGTGS